MFATIESSMRGTVNVPLTISCGNESLHALRDATQLHVAANFQDGVMTITTAGL